jgi:hypothetical protein
MERNNMNYNDMTGPELCMAVARREGVRPLDDIQISDCEGLLFSNGKVYNPLKNPSDAWPIILENGISINAPDYLTDPENGHGASTFDSPMIRDKNPLRAAIIVYLMMGEV